VTKKSGLLQKLRASSEWFIPTGAVALVFVMLVPLPSFVLDLLLTFSIMVSVLVLLTAIQILRPVQFSVFPSLILLLTLMRLSLDLACTRRILLHGNEGSTAAGQVIEAFGQFVVGGNYIVGFVIFLALIAIQYLVVSHGAVRTAEVTARFTLDAMPGKQMAIDSDLNTGLITADQARARREQVAREAEFCGSMDGAARFSQRDSLATILILTINIVAGFLIGVFQQGIPFQQALKTYTILTVGNGLVSIIPSLLVSVAGGIVVTRAGSDLSLGEDIGKQMFKTSRPLWIVSGVLLGLALIPGMPKMSFLLLGGVTMFGAWKMKPASGAELLPGSKAAIAKGAGAPVIDPNGRGA
jgi:flagellar biosynthesis protein FlhA